MANDQIKPDEANKTLDLKDRTCGIVMPISAIDPLYSAEHWRRVQLILEKAVRLSGLRPQLVWENSETDVIHSKIIQNIYENDVVICDISGLNPNVMLELGMRLSTKKPTLIVSDKEKNSPFDISIIEQIFYQRNLEFNAIELFITKLSNRIKGVSINGNYKSFVDNFQFVTVVPSKTDITANEELSGKMEKLTTSVVRLEKLFGAVYQDVPIQMLPQTSSITRTYSAKISMEMQEKALSDIFDIGRIESGSHTRSDDGTLIIEANMKYDSKKELQDFDRRIRHALKFWELESALG